MYVNTNLDLFGFLIVLQKEIKLILLVFFSKHDITLSLFNGKARLILNKKFKHNIYILIIKITNGCPMKACVVEFIAVTVISKLLPSLKS